MSLVLRWAGGCFAPCPWQGHGLPGAGGCRSAACLQPGSVNKQSTQNGCCGRDVACCSPCRGSVGSPLAVVAGVQHACAGRAAPFRQSAGCLCSFAEAEFAYSPPPSVGCWGAACLQATGAHGEPSGGLCAAVKRVCRLLPTNCCALLGFSMPAGGPEGAVCKVPATA